eukprot:353152-Chlamydomonas_euryale.AAC.11
MAWHGMARQAELSVGMPCIAMPDGMPCSGFSRRLSFDFNGDAWETCSCMPAAPPPACTPCSSDLDDNSCDSAMHTIYACRPHIVHLQRQLPARHQQPPDRYVLC